MEPQDPDWPDVSALQRGDDSALDRLMERHHTPLLSFVTRVIGRAQDAEEIAQETFVRAYFQISSFRPRGRFSAWLYQIARNLCRDYFRSRAFKLAALSEPIDRIPSEPLTTPIDLDSRAERIEAVQAGLLKVPLRLRECLILTAIEGLSHAEAAQRLGISPKAVETRSYRARRLLVKYLKIH